MDPALLPTIIKKGTSMMEDMGKEKKNLTWCQVFSQVRVIGTIVGLLLSVIVMFIPIVPDNPKVQRTLGILLLMATCWVTEIIPLSITALFPVVLFPMLGVLSASSVSHWQWSAGTCTFVLPCLSRPSSSALAAFCSA